MTDAMKTYIWLGSHRETREKIAVQVVARSKSVANRLFNKWTRSDNGSWYYFSPSQSPSALATVILADGEVLRTET